VRDAAPRRRFYSSVPAQTLIALLFDVTGLFAGGLISIFAPQFGRAPWILALFPPILTIRGDISGIFSGNLTTMLHLGVIHPRIRGNTDSYRSLISAIFVLTFVDTLAMGVISFALNLLFNRVAFTQLYVFITVPTVACIMAVALSIPLTSLIAIVTYRRGLDPDILVYPLLSSINDVVVTASFAVAVSVVLAGGAAYYLLGVVFLGLMFLCAFFTWRNRRDELFSKTLREGAGVVTLSSLFGSINGIFLSGLSKSLLRHPGLVVLYPALIDTLGDIGSIVGSLTTTSLALGYVKGFKEEVREGMRRMIKVEAVAALIHIVFGVVAYFIVVPSSSEASLLFLVGVALVSNLFTFSIISVFALVVAFLAFRRGLNPDNVVIPAITSTSDTAATLSILPALALIKLIGI